MLIVIASDRRFHAALEQPYWSMLDNHLAARLWRALGRPGATRPVLVRRVSLCQWLHACVVSESGHPACSCILIKHISVCQGARPAGPQSIRALVHPLTAAGTLEEASARRWLQAQGSAIRSLRGLSVGLERSGLGDVPGRDLDAGRLSTLLASIPSVTFICVDLRLDLHPIPTAAAIRPFLARAAHAIGRCSGLQTLRLGVDLLGGLSDQLPEALVRELAGARALKEVFLHFGSREADRPRWPAAFSLAHVMAGLAGLSRLRMLHLYVGNARCMPAGGAGPFGAPPRHERTRRVAPRARAAAATATSSARRRPTCAARACARTCRPAAPTAASAASSASACPTCRRAAAPARFAPVKQAPQLARQALGQSSARSALQCARPRTAPLRALLPATAQQHADPMRRRSCAWAAACPAACPSLADPPLALSRCMHAAHAGVPALRDHSWAECAAHRRLHRAARDSAAARVRAGSYPDSDLQPAPAPRPKRALRRVPDAPRRTRARADGAVRGRQLHRHLPQRCAHQVPDRQRPLLRQPADRPQLLRLLRQLLPRRPQQPRHARLHRRRARPPRARPCPSPPLA